MTDSTLLGLPYLEAAQSQKHVTHNEALAKLDLSVQLALQAIEVTSPPGAPFEGLRVHVGAGAGGAFAGMDGLIAAWQDGGWTFLAPRAGWLAFIESGQSLRIFDGAAWQGADTYIRELQNLLRLGLGTTADAQNPLAAKLNSALFTALATYEGGTGDLRFNLNKQSSGATVSQLYQTNYSARAETGLMGADNYAIKVSPDGGAWKVALSVDPALGLVTFPFGFDSPLPMTKLRRVEIFSTSGAFAKQAGDGRYFIQMVGGGGGGGSGARSAAGTAAGGGAGGMAGYSTECWFLAADIAATVSVSVGAGGAGAAAAAGNAAGASGGAGGATALGNYARAEGGSGGAGGSATSGGAGSISACDVDNIPVARTGGANGGLASAGLGSWQSLRASGGGGGGGISASNIVYAGGGAGRSCYRFQNYETLGGAGGAAGANGAAGQAPSIAAHGFGSGGGGGGPGGPFGGGGGGGAGGRNGFGGGAGGAGGTGMLRVFVFA